MLFSKEYACLFQEGTVEDWMPFGKLMRGYFGKASLEKKEKEVDTERRGLRNLLCALQMIRQTCRQIEP